LSGCHGHPTIGGKCRGPLINVIIADGFNFFIDYQIRSKRFFMKKKSALENVGTEAA
jgi:hypothetical protein